MQEFKCACNVSAQMARNSILFDSFLFYNIMMQTNLFGVVKVWFPKQKRDVAFSLKCEKSLVTVVCLHEVSF